MSINNIGMLY